MSVLDKIQNGEIISTFLGKNDKGILTSWIKISGHGWGVSFGGYAFDQFDPISNQRLGHAFGMEFIRQVLEVVGCDIWEDLKGKMVRIEFEDMKAKKIGNIVSDNWFDPKELRTTFYINRK